MVKIGIGADIIETENNRMLFEEGNVTELIGEGLYQIIKSCDMMVLNLEAPLINQGVPIKKYGSNLKTSEKSIETLKQINGDFYTLANNHIMDYGVAGLARTVELLSDNNIAFAGVGFNLEEARKPFIKEIDGIKIGIYCCAENEFSIAGEEKAGANPFDPMSSFDDVRRLKDIVDYVIVLYHGGKELYRYPTPGLQKVFRKFADVGADVCIAQHTHCVGCEEVYNHKHLIYGQGNFLFARPDDEFWSSSLFLNVLIQKGELQIEYIPVVKKEEKIRIANVEEAQEILQQYKIRSEEIMGDKVIQKKFDEFCELKATQYLRGISGRKSIWKKLYMKLFKIDKSFLYSEVEALSAINYMECETHREILLNVLKKNY